VTPTTGARPRKGGWTIADIPDQTGRVAVVTGANSGLGLTIAVTLARAGAHVVLACRNTTKADDAAASIAARSPRGSVEVAALDLADLASIAACAEGLSARHDRIDILANNAGLMAVDEGRTADGFEMQFGVNHLGHFALTAHLLPLLRATGGSRVVTMSSHAHRSAHLDLDDPMAQRKRYRRWVAYGQSKLANLLFTAELQRRLTEAGADTSAVAAHPGVTRTDLGAEGTGLSSKLFSALLRLAPTPEHGARPFLRAATDPAVPPGSFWGPRWTMFGPPVQETPKPAALDPSSALALWALSEQLTELHPFG
jgi:NAD(P)-dependent dehydrogenase (short-subunit alcohol dehydrogenase family)